VFQAPVEIEYNLLTTAKILLTSEAGDKIASKKNVTFHSGKAKGKVITVS
jgi:hypothetical protein